MKQPPKPPAGLARSGRELWKDVQSDYELTAGETRLLLAACRLADVLDRLAARAESEDVVVTGERGPRVNPVLAELRAQSIAFARVVAALRLPSESGARTQHRGVRGVYSLGER